MLYLSSHISATLKHVSSDVGDEVVILQLNSGKYFSLNEVGARVWTLIQETRTVREIRDVLVNEYTVTADKCEQDLFNILQEFLNKELIEIANEASS